MLLAYAKSVLDKFNKRGIIHPMQSSITLKGKDNMSNYTDEMVAVMTAAQPLNLEKAKELAAGWEGINHQSVISKARSLGLEYVSKPKRAASKKIMGPTKADILFSIRDQLGLPDREGDLTKAELSSILESFA